LSEWIAALLIAALAAALVALVYWLLVLTEGVYLGQRVVTMLYDWYATRYDDTKRFVPQLEQQHLAQPLMQEILPNRSPKVLDVACGTGRLPIALLRHAGFAGMVTGCDSSLRMLDVAARKTDSARVHFVASAAEALPFASASFDVVTCLEALEFLADRSQAVAEMYRVLQPGGTLLTTNRRTGLWLPGRRLSPGQLMAELERAGFTEVQFERWQVDYDKVWARRTEG